MFVVGQGIAGLGGQESRLRDRSGSFDTSIPPPPVVMILLPLKEKMPIVPREPGAFPL